jgi:hypothetical protein
MTVGSRVLFAIEFFKINELVIFGRGGIDILGCDLDHELNRCL